MQIIQHIAERAKPAIELINSNIGDVRYILLIPQQLHDELEKLGQWKPDFDGSEWTIGGMYYIVTSQIKHITVTLDLSTTIQKR